MQLLGLVEKGRAEGILRGRPSRFPKKTGKKLCPGAEFYATLSAFPCTVWTDVFLQYSGGFFPELPGLVQTHGVQVCAAPLPKQILKKPEKKWKSSRQRGRFRGKAALLIRASAPCNAAAPMCLPAHAHSTRRHPVPSPAAEKGPRSTLQGNGSLKHSLCLTADNLPWLSSTEDPAWHYKQAWNISL